MKTIGVIGGSGSVGRVVLDRLEKTEKYVFKAGYYANQPVVTDKKNFLWVKVDVYSEQSLKDFCSGCSIIVNCAGPSYLIKDRVALVAYDCGAVYIDAFGSDALRDSIKENGLESKGLFVLGAGLYPGLSGILSNSMLEEVDNPQSYVGMCGTCEPIQYAAAADLLQSSASAFGIPNVYLLGGEVKVIPRKKRQEVPSGMLPGSIYADCYLNDEIYSIFKQKGLEKVLWFNLTEKENLAPALEKAYSAMMNPKSQSDFYELVKTFVKDTESVESKWNILCIEIEGLNNNRKVIKRATVRHDSAYEITGMTIAKIVENIDSNMKGVYWPYEVVDCGQVMGSLENELSLVKQEVPDSWMSDISKCLIQEETMESGVL